MANSVTFTFSPIFRRIADPTQSHETPSRIPQLEHIEAIEKRLWSAADNLRANSNFASNQYFLPVMGLVFLRHAYSRYLTVKEKIEPNLPSRGGKTRPLSKEDFSQQSAIFLRPEAQFDSLVALPDSADRARALTSAGGGEAKVRQKLVETGDVDAMIAIRSNFFYTRTVPCELWFLNRNKPKVHKDKVLMIDARNVYRKVTRKIYDFSPKQQQNLQAIVWLYRGETERYLELVSEYLSNVIDEARAGFDLQDESGQTTQPLPDYAEALKALRKTLTPFLNSQPKTGPQAEVLQELEKESELFDKDIEQFRKHAQKAAKQWEAAPVTNASLLKLTTEFTPLAEACRDLIKQTDLIYKLATRLIDSCEKECNAKNSSAWSSKDITRARKAADEARQFAVEQLKQVRYFWKQAHWLTERFPDAKLRDVEGLVKLVTIKEIEVNDWSLTPGRYVGVAPEEVDENFDFEETLREIHVELEDLNAESITLAATIKRNFEELGI